MHHTVVKSISSVYGSNMLQNIKFEYSNICEECGFAVIIMLFFYAATLVLVDMSQGCSGEMVTYSCTVTQGFALQWIVDPFIVGSDPIQFVLGTTPIGRSVDCNGVTPPQCSNIIFVATFTNAANRMTGTNGDVADMTSTLTITTTVRLNGTVVQCRRVTESGSATFNRTLHIAGAPMLLFVSIVVYA